MNRSVFRILSLLLCAAMIFSLAACGKGSDDTKPETGTEAQPTTSEYAYLGSFTPIKTDSQWGVTPFLYTDDGFYATAQVVVGRQPVPEGQVEEYDGQYDIYGTMLYFVDKNGKAERLPNYVPTIPKENTENYKEFYSYCNMNRPQMNAEGKLVAIEENYAGWFDGPDSVYGTDEMYDGDYFRSEQTFDLVVLDTDGTELSRAQIDVDTTNSYLNVWNSALSPDGNLLVLMETTLLAVAPDGSIAWTISSDDYLNSIVTLADGSVAVMVYGDKGPVLRPVDTEAHSFGEPVAIPDSAWSFIPGDDNYDLYYTSGLYLYGLRLGEEPEQLLNWMSCDINGQYLDSSSLNISADGTISGVISEYREESTECEIFTLSRVPASSLPKKEIITVAQLEYNPDYQFSNRMVRFNRSHDDVRIEYVDYTQYNTEDDSSIGLTKFLTELSAGKTTDIIPMNQLPYRQLAAKGVLEDLYPYIDADSKLSRSDFFPNVLSALESNGGLYQVVSGFSVETLAGAASIVGDTPGWTYDEYNAALARMPEGCTPLEPWVTRDQVLSSQLYANISDYVNWNTGEVNFETDSFKQMLTFVKSFPEEFDWENYDNSESTQDLIRQGRQMLTQSYLYGLEAMLWNDANFGGKTTYIGWPVTEGVGSILRLDSGYGMSRSSAHKEAVWEFLRGMLTEEGQTEVYSIPTNRNVFNKQLEKIMTPEYRKDSEGNYLLDENGDRLQEPRASWIDGNGEEHAIYAMTQEQADEVLNIIETCDHVADYDSSIFDIVNEQAQAFFAGQRSVDEVARLIQSKANIYVNEQR